MPDTKWALRQDILRPKIRLKDSASGETLCSYALEEQPLEERQRCTSVVMCRMFREESGPKCALIPCFLSPRYAASSQHTGVGWRALFRAVPRAVLCSALRMSITRQIADPNSQVT